MPTPPPDDDVPDYVQDPATRKIIADRMKEAAANTVVEPILSFDNAEIPPDPLAHDFDLGCQFMAVRLYEAAIGLRYDADQMALPDWMRPGGFKARALESLLFTVASDPQTFRQEATANPDGLLQELVGYALSDTYQKMLAEHDQIAQMKGGAS